MSEKKKGWLSREDFEVMDGLFEKMGYGGYYDFLELLKMIGSKIGAFTVPGGEIDRMDVKTIQEMEVILSNWSYLVMNWRVENPDWCDWVLGLRHKR